MVEIRRKTRETDISLDFNLYGIGSAKIDTGIGFLDHMLELMSFHGKLDMTLTCSGDTNVDAHHSVEDIGIVLGKAVRQSLQECSGIARYSTTFTPMDEALSRVSMDISGRAYLVYNVDFTREMLGGLDTELVEEFFQAFIREALVTLHIQNEYGRNNHHICESIFKGFGRALKEATEKVGGGIPSTKGSL